MGPMVCITISSYIILATSTLLYFARTVVVSTEVVFTTTSCYSRSNYSIYTSTATMIL